MSKNDQTSKMIEMDATNIKVLLYVPNIIGYLRFALVHAAFYNINSSATLFIILYSVSILLDFFDGYLARKFNQCSLFGAWLDVIIDNYGRGLLWVHLHPCFYVISALEWVTFVCNYQLGPDWKQQIVHKNAKNLPRRSFSYCVSKITSNNFRNFWGVWSIAGLHVLPVWVYGIQQNIFNTHLRSLPNWAPMTGLIILTCGRFICFVGEVGSIMLHSSYLLIKVSSEKI